MHKKLINTCLPKILALFCLFPVLFLFISCQSQLTVSVIQDDYATQVSNYNNFSYMTESGGKIYFSRIDEENSDLYSLDFDKVDSGIYVMDLTGENIKKISDMYGRFIQVVNDKLYFNTWLPETGLYRMNLDGSDLELMIEGAWLEFFVYKDAIYYVADMYHPFRKYDLKTGEIVTVLDDFGAIHWIDNGYLYFSYDHEPFYYCMNLETEEIQLLKSTEDTPQRFIYDGKSIFYSTYEAIHRIALNNDSGKINPADKMLIQDIKNGFNLIRNGAYFYYFELRPQLQADDGKSNLVSDLYRIDEKGRKKELLISGLDQRVQMYIVGGDLYITELDSDGPLITGYSRFNFENKTLEPLVFPEN